MSFKVAFIGAGSIGFTRGLVRDLLAVPEFGNIEIALTDISRRNLDMVAQLCRRDIQENGSAARLTSTIDRRAALRNAKYVFSVVRVGGLEAFQQDIDIPLKYGIDQCVGDTLCAGGIMYGQRGIAALLDFCRDIKEVAAPGCMLINHANPLSMLTWACSKYGGVNTVGLCHGVEGGHTQIASVIELLVNEGRKGGKKNRVKVDRRDVDIVCAGINHQTWFVSVLYNGKDWTGRLLEGFEKHPVYRKTEKLRIDMLRRFGYYCTESNGHMSEYLPWYRKRPEEIHKWIDTSSWIGGETGGYLRICREGRDWFKTDFPNWLKEPPLEFSPEKRGGEHGSYIIEALETGRVYRGHFNAVNRGCIRNLPDDCVIEAPGYVDRNGVSMPLLGDLPRGCAALCNQSVSVQRLAVEAAVHGNDMLLRQAMLMDPLTGAVCNPPEVWQLVDEMLVAQARWLPQYSDAIKAARRRMARGRLLKTRQYRGAARVRPKTVARMKKDRKRATRMAAAADKAAENEP